MKLNYVVLLIFLGTSLAVLPLQQSLLRGMQLLGQLAETDDSPVSQFLTLLQEKFLHPQKPPKGEDDEGGSTSGIWRTLFRSIGLHSKETPAIAVNLIIFLAQMVGNAFPLPAGSERVFKNKRSLFENVLEQPQVSRLMSTMLNPKLMDLVIQEASGHLSGRPSDCVVLLLCRSAPVVKGMQTSLNFFLRQGMSIEDQSQPRGERQSKDTDSDHSADTLLEMTATWKHLSPMQRFFFFMPSFPDFMAAGELCRKKYSQCTNQ